MLAKDSSEESTCSPDRLRMLTCSASASRARSCVARSVLAEVPAGREIDFVDDQAVVHFHDVFLPFEYPEEWVMGDYRYWDEQYLLQAFLSGTPNWRGLMPVHALYRLHQGRVADLIPRPAQLA